MKHRAAEVPTVRRLAIAVGGVVQGVGFRPFVYNAARAAELTGWVSNEADTVRIEVQGPPAALDAFVQTLRQRHPPQARIDRLDVSQATCEDGRAASFRILPGTDQESRDGRRWGPAIPADLATCDDCLAEIQTASQRRYGYPFTNCTNCGPRWSIIERLPYDRPRTSMARFEMCPDCRAEYDDPADRRFHAQPIACPRCGPSLQLLDGKGREVATGQQALAEAMGVLLGGRVVAVKGLGGFQLLVDATNSQAVALLRKRKQRPDRPFAVMLLSLDDARRRCEVSDEEARLLSSHEAPIVLLRRRTDARRHAYTGACDDVVEGVAPGNPYLGVMLPYTPLHHLLLAALHRPIVCTSGNISEEPMAIEAGDALRRLGSIGQGVTSSHGVADAILTHDRPIVRPVDDSVARLGPDGPQILRRARGYAPLPIDLVPNAPTVLAVGGHLKNTVALGLSRSGAAEGDRSMFSACTSSGMDNPLAEKWTSPRPKRERLLHGVQVILSPHVGDLDNVLSVEVHRRTIRDLLGFFRVQPEVVACDLHPDYASTREAEALAAEWDVPLVRVQHHHAHVAACMAEHGLEGTPEEPVLGLSWDGTGYGPDGTVWGGEALVCHGAEFRRVAHLRTFALPGPDRAVREPRRSALGLLHEVLGERAGRYAAEWFSPAELKTLVSALARSLHCPRTSSMGRLFDAVAALCGLPAVISFEGQVAMALEFAADSDEPDAYPLPLDDATPAVADWEPLLRAVLRDRDTGEPIGRISGRFHNALAEMAVAVARRVACRRLVLTGGCFQNALLTERVRARLLASGFDVYVHHRVPPGDGGIALGQVLVAAHQTGN